MEYPLSARTCCGRFHDWLRPGFRHPDPGQHMGEHGAVVDVARGQHERQRASVAITRQMNFRSRTTTRTSDGMINWFAVPAPGSVVPLCEPHGYERRRRAGEREPVRNPPRPATTARSCATVPRSTHAYAPRPHIKSNRHLNHTSLSTGSNTAIMSPYDDRGSASRARIYAVAIGLSASAPRLQVSRSRTEGGRQPSGCPS